jgi:hypothetical protein
MDEDEEFSLSPFVSSVITECTSYLNDPREENKMEVLKPSQWIEPVEVHCTLGCEDDVTDHTRKQNSEKTLEKVTKPADHVSIHTDIVCGMRYIHPLQLIPFLRDSGT